MSTAGIGPYHPLVASTLNNLGSLLQARGAIDEAEPLYKRALEIQTESSGPDSMEAAHVLNNLASLMQAKKNYKVAGSALWC